MIKLLPMLAFALICGSSYAQDKQESNYQLLINGKAVSIDLDKPTTFKTAKGEELKLELKQNDILHYLDDMVSLNYPKEYAISKSAIDADIEQLALLTANGSGIMIQKYRSMNPSVVVDLMLQEVCKESISYGYKSKETTFEKKLVSGHLLKGKTAKLNYKDDEQHYTVAAYGGKDEGIVIMTMMNSSYIQQDEKVLKLVLDTLSYVKK